MLIRRQRIPIRMRKVVGQRFRKGELNVKILEDYLKDMKVESSFGVLQTIMAMSITLFIWRSKVLMPLKVLI